MSEIKKTCNSCGAEIDNEAESCPQCGNTFVESASELPQEQNDMSPLSEPVESSNKLSENNPKTIKMLILAAIAVGVLIVGLIGGFFINLFAGNNGTILSGPWNGNMTFTKITSSDKTLENQNQANLNKPQGIELNVFMYNNKKGGVSVSGLSDTGVVAPLTYSNGKMKFSIKKGDITVAFDCTITYDKASGNHKMKGTIKYTGKVDNGAGKKIDLNATGNLELTLIKRK